MTTNGMLSRRPRPSFAVLAAAPSLRRTAARARCALSTFPPRAALQGGDAEQVPAGDPAQGRVGRAARIPVGDPASSRVAAGTAREPAPLSEDDAFSWTEQWYAVGFEADIIDGTPFPCTVFDTNLVIFRESAGGYSALLDRCSHRLAPLSEGRIVEKDNGCVEIECAYHGWQFSGSGACTKIPQSRPGSSIPRSASVRTFPAVAEREIVFVWFGDPARADPATIPIPPHVRAYAEKDCRVSRTFASVVPYSFETLVENILDPAHVEFAHRGAMPFRNRGRSSGGNRPYELPMRSMPGGVISATWGVFQMEYFPPTFITYKAQFPGMGRFDQLFHVTPVDRRRARLSITDVLSETKPVKMFLFSMTPRWRKHVSLMGVLDGDTPLLRGVERWLGEPENWKRLYGPPAGAVDGAILRFRKWMDVHRDSMPWVGDGGAVPVGETLSRREVNDRLKYHTERCSACSGALRGWEGAKKVVSMLKAVAMMGLVSAGMLAVLVWASVVPATAWSVLSLTGAVLLGVVFCFVQVERLCAWYIELLTYTDNSRKLYLTTNRPV